MKKIVVALILLIGSMVANEFVVPKQKASSIAQYREQCIESFAQLLQQYAQFDQKKGKLQEIIISLTGIVDGQSNDLFTKATRSTYETCNEKIKKIQFHLQKAEEEMSALQTLVQKNSAFKTN